MWPTPQPLLSNLKNRSQLFIGSGNHKPSLMMKLGLVKEQTLIPKLKGLKKKLTQINLLFPINRIHHEEKTKIKSNECFVQHLFIQKIYSIKNGYCDNYIDMKLHKYGKGFFYDVQPRNKIEKCRHIDKNHKMMQPYKALLINTPQMWKMFKGIRKRKMENLQEVKLAQFKC